MTINQCRPKFELDSHLIHLKQVLVFNNHLLAQCVVTSLGNFGIFTLLGYNEKINNHQLFVFF
jgi:hypothetical protein